VPFRAIHIQSKRLLYVAPKALSVTLRWCVAQKLHGQISYYTVVYAKGRSRASVLKCSVCKWGSRASVLQCSVCKWGVTGLSTTVLRMQMGSDGLSAIHLVCGIDIETRGGKELAQDGNAVMVRCKHQRIPATLQTMANYPKSFINVDAATVSVALMHAVHNQYSAAMGESTV
jgi:hypothetical protein